MVSRKNAFAVSVLCCALWMVGFASAQQFPMFDLGGFQPSTGSPSFFIGWAPNASFISLAASAFATDGVDSAQGEGKILWSTNGLWLGLGLPAPLSERFSVSAEGWVFIPGNRHVEAWGRGTSTAYGPASVSGNLDIDTAWFAVDLGCSYEAADSFWVLGGVRYDYLQATISAPGALETLIYQEFGPVRAKVDVGLNSIFPYVGLMHRVGTENRNVVMSLKGFPGALSVADARPKSGWFAEFGVECNVNPSDSLSLSAFGRVDTARAVFDEFSDIANIFGVEPDRPPYIRSEQDLAVHWVQYIIGARVTLDFWSLL